MADNATEGQMSVFVSQKTLQTGTEEGLVNLKGTKRGELCIVDFWTEMAIEGHAFQMVIGTASTAVAGDIVMTTTAADGVITAATGMTFIPAEGMISFDTAGTTDAEEVTFKSVGTAHTAATGTVFTPLPLLMGGIPSRLTCETQTACGVTVAADAATTTRQHFHQSREFSKDAADEWETKNMLAPYKGITRNLGWKKQNPVIWRPAVPPILRGVACLYLTVSSATAAPTFFAHTDWVEMATGNID